MSKAFTKESDHDDELSLLPEMPDDVRNYITPRGYRVLQLTLETLADAATKAEPDSATQRELEQRVHYLRSRLDLAEIVDPSVHAGNEQIFFGATVTYKDQNKASHTVNIVGLDESDPVNGRVSWLSPVAQALLTACEGDTVELDGPTGTEELKIVSVAYPAAD